jgi:hypothetical protein
MPYPLLGHFHDHEGSSNATMPALGQHDASVARKPL